MKKYFLLLTSTLLMSCSATNIADCTDCKKAPTTLLIPNAHNTIKLDSTLDQDLSSEVVIAPVTAPSTLPAEKPASTPAAPKVSSDNISSLFHDLSAKVKAKWGDEGYVQSSKHRLVKYLDDYNTKADIQFDNGKIVISTIASVDAKQRLHDAIVQVVLMPRNAEHIDLFTAKAISSNSQSEGLLFFGQILDHDQHSIEWQWRADRFANYLVENKLQKKTYGKVNAEVVQIDLVANHLELRQKLYADTVQKMTAQYAVEKDLVNAVIATESSFNPYSVSSTGGVGLMQIVPATAGADVFKLVKKTGGQPTTSYLLNPNNNIELGTAYLHLLSSRYLRDVTNPASNQLATIAAYNSGTSNVLLTFDQDKAKAVKVINLQTPEQVYDLLVTRHPRAEARTYLEKVMRLKKTTI